MVSTSASSIPFSLPSLTPVVRPGSGDPFDGDGDGGSDKEPLEEEQEDGDGDGDMGKPHHHSSDPRCDVRGGPNITQCTSMKSDTTGELDESDGLNVHEWTKEDGKSKMKQEGEQEGEEESNIPNCSTSQQSFNNTHTDHLIVPSDKREPNGNVCAHVWNREQEEEEEETNVTCWSVRFRGDRAHTVGPEYRIEAKTGSGGGAFVSDHHEGNDVNKASVVVTRGRGRRWTGSVSRLSGSLDKLFQRCSKTRDKLFRLSVSDWHLSKKSDEAKSASAIDLGTPDDDEDAERGGGVGDARELSKPIGKCVTTTTSGKNENKRKVSFDDLKFPKLGVGHYTKGNHTTRKLSVDVPHVPDLDVDRGPSLEVKSDDCLEVPVTPGRQRHRSRSFGDAFGHPYTFKKHLQESYKSHLARNKIREQDEKNIQGKTREAVATYEARIARAQSESDCGTSPSRRNVTHAPRTRSFWARFSFKNFLASFIPRLPSRKFSDTPSSSSHCEGSVDGDTIRTNQMGNKDGNIEDSPVVDDDADHNNKKGTCRKGSQFISSGADKGLRRPQNFQAKSTNTEGCEEEDDVFCADKKLEHKDEEDDFEYMQQSGWVKLRVKLLERQILTKMEEEARKSRRNTKGKLTPERIQDTERERGESRDQEDREREEEIGRGREETGGEGEEGRKGGEREGQGEKGEEGRKGGEREGQGEKETVETTGKWKDEAGIDKHTTNNNTTALSDHDDDDDSDTEVEEEVTEELGEIVTLRSRSRNDSTSIYRYSDRPTSSVYRYSVVRPRTVIIGLGVCTETKFFSESFGDGVSETESDDEEEDGVPNAHTNASSTSHSTRTTPTTPRAPSPSRTSRPHSPLSDMDVESKRNSQAVSTEPSDLEDHSSVTTSDRDSCHDLAALDARKDRSYRTALELLHTERTYVKVLHLIDQEFQFRVDHDNRATHMFPAEVIPQMFSNVKSIYKLHHDFLLPQLEDRMAQWHLNPRIGDIMKSFAPFLKMYTEYVRNFDNAMTLINQWQAKSPRFAAIMDDIHSMEACGNLTLQHHMLSPVQRIPRYEMLLRDYLRKLPEDSPDSHDTEKALHLVSTAANHANDAMKKIDKFEKLLEIQESLGGAEDLVSPTRELIKEGKIIKISARSGDHQERYIFLLTDLLLLCSPRLMGGRVMSGPQYRLRAKYHVENLIVQEGDNLETANTFYIKDNNKSVELYTQTIEEKEQWLEAFIRAIHETSQRKSSLKLHFNPDQRIIDVDLGQKQPMLIRSDSVTKCMECGSQFTMVRRKHHCRACGAVVCSKCSSFKASLAYECGKSVRVCRRCHATLQEMSSSTATPSPEIDDGEECSMYNAKEPPDMPFRNRGVLEVSAKTGGAVIQGFLQLKTHRKTWVRRWFALHTDFVLYSFKCEADEQALTATPVPGFTVTPLQGTRNESGISDKEKERAFKLHHAKKQYVFQAASKEESLRWMASLKKASQAELPSPVQ
ncbi:hypothetical protein Pmani_000652 [Petrolisthes manimaculis]|uniref:FYVE, RhoGEF and PH domain-containing protein 4 n=1 Tax=Petrolisthes manimaculis TaxID=1843537 RepID=A0AAE1QM18_9EUCA|nr:hypothetical protein Pmani_000652 [Petrolisthes manimaculis]